MTLVDEGLTERILGAAIEVHRYLGPGLLESSYRRCLLHELMLREVPATPEVPVSLDYKGLNVAGAYRLDLLVDDRVIVELKAVDRLHPVHKAQLLTYLRLTGKRVGLLLNFNECRLRDGIVRVVL